MKMKDKTKEILGLIRKNSFVLPLNLAAILVIAAD